ncbi:hypothetical protein BLA24_06700 [Streptomyces cinnamoneus]|uniref:Cholesterol esterase n=1 Tax=Streptomyces cinnamoneus TaxID=53446 RepID=A0A2G1XMM0_STRCJ|nr:DUF6230 family protein [Streptomyces cinnamoneus]PHQ52466.1 hypothetical protein BLA24_06700 [Streptomyces cinnamoneus]PPT15999.1 hypothetical protein CYQ11_26850 [Streptomyces cinnamoneus]
MKGTRRKGGRRVSRRRLAAASFAGLALAGGLLMATANGVLAVSAAGSGGAFKLTGERLEGDAFRERTDVIVERDGTRHPVAVVSAERAWVKGLCASLLVPTPFGPLTLRGSAGRTRPVLATGIVINTDRVRGGDTSFSDLRVGLLPEGGVGAATGHAAVDRPEFTSWLATAGTFRMSDVDVGVEAGRHECS